MLPTRSLVIIITPVTLSRSLNINLLDNKRTIQIIDRVAMNEQLYITKEEIEAATKNTKHLHKARTALLSFEHIADPLAKVIEKRRLFLIKNWTEAWAETQLLSDKPTLPDKVWKRIAFGQYNDIAEFLEKDLDQAVRGSETPFKLTDTGLIRVERERRNKSQLYRSGYRPGRGTQKQF